MVWRHALVYRHSKESVLREAELRRGYLWLTLDDVKPQKLRGSDPPPFPPNPTIAQKLKLAEQDAKEEARQETPYSEPVYVPKPHREIFTSAPVGVVCGDYCLGFECFDRLDGNSAVFPLELSHYLSGLIAGLQDRYTMPYFKGAMDAVRRKRALGQLGCLLHCGGCAALGTALEQDRRWEEAHNLRK